MIFNKIAKCTLLKITFVCININLVQADYCKVPCNHGFCKIPPGYCKCDPGFGGPSCDLERPSSYIERDKRTNNRQHIYFHNSKPLSTEPRASKFKSTCLCQNGGVCDATCKCPPGWTGDVCAKRCQPGRFGQNCIKACECFNGASCDHVTGDCICEPGFMGDKCINRCPIDKFGVNCMENCSCGHGAACDKATGRCFCTTGWIGIECNERQCPENKFGEDCAATCDCDKNNTISCHPYDGKCECKPGFNTTDCRTIDIVEHEAHLNESFWIIFCIVFIVTFAVIIFMIYFCYRRRVTILRAEMTNAAKYLASECNHFDNVEYTMQSNNATKAATRSHNATKLNEDHLSNSSTYEDSALCVQCTSNYESSSHNNYQTIEDHLYDEIVKKSQEIVESDTEYDHLDHSRPLQKLHPNYHYASISNIPALNRQNRIEAPSPFDVIYEELQFYEQPIYSNVASVPKTSVTKQT